MLVCLYFLVRLVISLSLLTSLRTTHVVASGQSNKDFLNDFDDLDLNDNGALLIL